MEIRDLLGRRRIVERHLGLTPLRHGRQQLLGGELGVADDPDVRIEPAADVGPDAVDLYQRHLRHGRAEAGGQEIEPRTEHDHAVRLIRHAPRDRVRERADNAETPGIAAEEVLAARRGHHKRADALGEGLDRFSCARAMRAETGDDERLLGLGQDGSSSLDRLRRRRLRLPVRRANNGSRCRMRDLGQLHVGRQVQADGLAA